MRCVEYEFVHNQTRGTWAGDAEAVGEEIHDVEYRESSAYA